MDNELESELTEIEVRLAQYIDFEVSVALKGVNKKLIVGGVLIVAIGAAVFTNAKAMLQLAQGLQALNTQVETLTPFYNSMVVKQPPEHYPSRTDIEKMVTPTRNGKIDETLIMPENEVSEPFEGPASETSEAVAEAMAHDPLNPAEMFREPGVE